MKHYGDITKISGFDIEPVDVITGGSPCQDLSIAGKQTGLAGERSGLFMEQIRVIKEMREADAKRGRAVDAVRPRYMVWENVPGAFSTNKGKDFATVLQETAKIIEPQAPFIPVPEGGWPYAGCLTDGVGGRWSVAWRVHDAQFWGVPQRRRRIALVADFGGLSAPEILFERKGLSRDIEPGKAQREESACGTGNSIANTSTYCIQGNCIDRAETAGCNGKGWTENVAYTLNTIDRQAVCAGFKAGQSGAGGLGYEEEKAPTLSAKMSGLEPTVYDARGNGDGKTVCTITGDHENRITDYTALCVSAVDCRNLYEHPEISGTLQSKQTGGFSLNYQNPIHVISETAHTLKAKANCDFRADSETYPIQNNVVRRLTPLECERLQGYPDGWADIGEWVESNGKKHKPADSPRYKALGNSIALPFWLWLLRRISAQYYRPATLGSLFDGIGGFPLCWERCNGKGTALWASEIDEFAIAVTKHHFI